MTEEQGPTFGSLREDALAAFETAICDADGCEHLCRQQGADDCHVGAYCNTQSYLDAVRSLLIHGSWCDEIDIEEAAVDEALGGELFGLYTLVFLPIEQVLESVREISRVASNDRSRGLTDEGQELMDYINNVWKHRCRSNAGYPEFNKTHHHGDYIFAECKDCVAVLAEGDYVSIDHQPTGDTRSLTLVIPELKDAISRLGVELSALSALLDEAPARQRVAARWGATLVEADS